MSEGPFNGGTSRSILAKTVAMYPDQVYLIMTMLSAPEGIDCRSQRPASCLPWPPCSRPSSASPPSAASTTCAAWKLEHPKLSLLSPIRRGRHLDPPGCCTLCYELRRQGAVQVQVQLHLQIESNAQKHSPVKCTKIQNCQDKNIWSLSL